MFRIMFSADLQLFKCLCRLQPFVLRFFCVLFAFLLRITFFLFNK